jgi:exodeoxyribonuclease V alpha subunit
VPATIEGIRKYLGSGMIKGLGPVMAGRIVERFGKTTLDVIEDGIERLGEVPGIGPKRIATIAEAWQTQREIRDVMLFLQSHAVSTGFAAKIFKRYGSRSVAVVTENPYRLAEDIAGVGFLTADRIAEKVGIPRNSPLRLEAGVLFVLRQVAVEGHVLFPRRRLSARCREILSVDGAGGADGVDGVDAAAIERAVTALAAGRRIVLEAMADGQAEDQAVYLAPFHLFETSAARKLRVLLEVPRALGGIDVEAAAAWVQGRMAVDLSGSQLAALRGALTHKAIVITGGPGTGKTTIVNAVVQVFEAARARVMLAAPTGRAAKRLSEATGREARTIHRLLEFSPQNGGFERNADNPLACDLLVVDEASMIDIALIHHLLEAVPAQAGLILVGDVHQLPSVGPGNVLGDIIDSQAVPVLRLTEIFRQARQSLIIVNAHAINAGRMPALSPAAESGPGQDFYFVEQPDPERVLEHIVEFVVSRIPRRFGLDPVEDIQVLTPMHKGVVGAENLNRRLQEALNPGEGGVAHGERLFRENDKVMQVRNNYDKEVFNGDIGRIAAVRPGGRELDVRFEGRHVTYDFSELDELSPAYAVSVHKSQGSEYPAVVFPVLTQHYILLQRNLIYTALTRARRLAVLVGTRRALAIGIRSGSAAHRWTRLSERLGSAG